MRRELTATERKKCNAWGKDEALTQKGKNDRERRWE